MKHLTYCAVVLATALSACGGGGSSPSPLPSVHDLITVSTSAGSVGSTAAAPYPLPNGEALLFVQRGNNDPTLTVNVAQLTTPTPCVTVDSTGNIPANTPVYIAATDLASCKYPITVELQFSDTTGEVIDEYFAVSFDTNRA